MGLSFVFAGATKVVDVAKDVQKTMGRRTSSGLGVTHHSVSRRIERQIRSADELDALKNPLTIKDLKIDNRGDPVKGI